MSNYTRGKGRIAVDLYDFKDHTDGYSSKHSASSIEVDNTFIYNNGTNVQDVLEDLSVFANAQSNNTEGFVSIPDGYNTWENANGIINFDPTIPSLDLLLNEVFQNIYNKSAVPARFERVKNGGVILLKAGTYIVRDTIEIPPGITLLGEGFGTKIINATGLNTPSLGVAPSPRSTYIASNVTATTPIKITTSVANNLVTGDKVVMRDVDGITAANGVFTITRINSTNFTLNGSIGSGVWGGHGSVEFARPIFKVLPDFDRSTTDSAIDPNLFMFLRSTKLYNMVIADNFVENTVLGDVYYKLPQSKSSVIPFISQSMGSSLEINNCYLAGRVNFSSGTVVSAASSIAVKLDNEVAITNGTFLKITESFIDGFSQAVEYKTLGGSNDHLEILNSKIRVHGYLDSSAVSYDKNCIVNMNDNNVRINNNYLYLNSSVINTGVFVSDTVATSVNLQNLAKVLISGNNISSQKTTNTNVELKLIRYESSIQPTIGQKLVAMSYGNAYQGSTGFEHTTAKKQKTVLITEDYVMDSNEADYIVLVDTNTAVAPLSVTLPPHEDGREIIIADVGSNAGVNQITLVRNGGTGQIGDAAANYLIAQDDVSVTLISNSGNWYFLTKIA